MKAKPAPFLFACFFSTLLFAQQDQVKQYLSLSTGFSFPSGQFANKSIEEPKAGWAGTGGTVRLEYIRLLGKRYGVVFSLSGMLHPVNTRTTEEAFADAIIRSPGVYFTSQPQTGQPVITGPGMNYPDWDFKKASWKMAGFWAGVYRVLPAKNITWHIKTQAGLVYAGAPAIDGNGYSGDTARIRIEQTKAAAWGMGYTIGFGFQKPISRQFYFTAAAAYTGTAQLVFKDVTATLTTVKSSPFSQSISSASINGNAKGKITSFSLHAGMAWALK